MANSLNSSHPSPHASRVGLLGQAVGVAAAPTAWAIRLMINLAIASSACLPDSAFPGRASNLSKAWSIMLGVDIAALAVASACAMIAHRGWRDTKVEKPGSHNELLNVGEGRARFLALCGVIVSLGFALATLFDLIALLIVPICER